MRIAIHQPNYLPWLGLIHKIANSDIFVVFDDVQLRRGKSYVIRTKIKTQGGSRWLTIPVKKTDNFVSINQAIINNELNWREDHWNSIYENYKKAPHFSEVQDQFMNSILDEHERLVDNNVELITLILRLLNINTRIVRSSELDIDDFGTKKIIKIIKKLGGDEYITGKGEGSKKYVLNENKAFERDGIKLIIQEFKHPEYAQLYGEFIPRLSICDAIFNLGSKETVKMLSN